MPALRQCRVRRGECRYENKRDRQASHGSLSLRAFTLERFYYDDKFTSVLQQSLGSRQIEAGGVNAQESLGRVLDTLVSDARHHRLRAPSWTLGSGCGAWASEGMRLRSARTR
jgi:hypothetical protein